MKVEVLGNSPAGAGHETVSRKLQGALKDVSLHGNLGFIFISAEEILCREDIPVRNNLQIIRYFDLCSGSITTSEIRHSGECYSDCSTDTEVSIAVSAVNYKDLEEDNPYRKKMTRYRSAVAEALKPGP